MDLIELKKQIIQNKLNNFYCFVGEDISLQGFYLKQIKGVKRVDTVLEVWNKLTSKSKLLGNTTNTVYVVRDDSDFISNNKLEQLLEQIKYNTLILCLTDVKKTSKAYKVLKEYMVEFNTMTTKQLISTVQNIYPMDSKKCEAFIEACDNNYGVILSELDKIPHTSIDVIQEAIDSSITYSTFTFIDMLFKKDYNTVSYLVKLLDSGVNEMGILTLIFQKASQLLQLTQGINPEGLNEWAGKNMLKYNKLNQKELYRATRWAKLYEEGIKSGDYNAYDAVLLCTMKIL